MEPSRLHPKAKRSSRRRVRPSAPSAQTDLFPAPTLPEGFRYHAGVLSFEEEEALAREFAHLPFKPFDFQGFLANRQVVSFGYRYGVPSDADLVLDVRFLPNPHFVPRLRPFTGKDPKVRRYIRSFPQTGEFLRRIEGLLTYLIPHYIREGKSYLTIAFGCTGGKHRSVMLAESVAKSLAKRGYSAKVVHRDIEK